MAERKIKKYPCTKCGRPVLESSRICYQCGEPNKSFNSLIEEAGEYSCKFACIGMGYNAEGKLESVKTLVLPCGYCGELLPPGSNRIRGEHGFRESIFFCNHECYEKSKEEYRKYLRQKKNEESIASILSLLILIGLAIWGYRRGWFQGFLSEELRLWGLLLRNLFK